MVGCGGPDLDDKETLDGIIAEAIDWGKLQEKGEEGEQLYYAPNQQTPYTGWVKVMWGNEQVRLLAQYKDGKGDGLFTSWYEKGQKEMEGNVKDGKPDGFGASWYENGQKDSEGNYKGGKLMTVFVWKPNGEKCPVTKLHRRERGCALVQEGRDGGASPDLQGRHKSPLTKAARRRPDTSQIPCLT